MVLQSLNLPAEAFFDDLMILTQLSFFAFITPAESSETVITHQHFASAKDQASWKFNPIAPG